jgi:hypothetical protein
LAREIAEAKADLTRSLADLKSSAAASADLSAWARAYPWPTIAASAAAGFALAAMLHSKTKQQSPSAEMSEENEASETATAASGTNKGQSQRSFLRSISFAAFDLAKVLIETLLVSAIRNAQVPSSPESPSAADVRDAAAV